MVDFEAIIIVATAFLLGLGHSLDPDHVVAVSTLLCKSPSLRKSIVSATAWGAGHSAVLLVVGLLVLGLRIVIPNSVVQIFEVAAAVMLIALGIYVIRPIVVYRLHQHEHRSGQEAHTHTHPHVHSHGHSHIHDHEDSGHIHKSALTGVLQGLAGSAAIMLVALTTVTSWELGLIYILIFGAGVILGMVGIACLISSLLSYTANRIEGIHEKITAVTGTISISFGIFIITQILLNRPI